MMDESESALEAATEERIFVVGVDEEQNEIFVDLNNLGDIFEIIELLKEFNASLKKWLTIAEHLRDMMNFNDMAQVLVHAKDHSANDVNPIETPYKLKILALLAGCYIQFATTDVNNETRAQYISAAEDCLNEAEIINRNDVVCTVYRGHLALIQEKFEHAKARFSFVLSVHDANNILALLGRACVDFHDGNYAEALEQYRKVLRLKPDCPSSIRVGIGMCFAKLKRFKKAKLAFERALQLDSHNVEALVGLAVLQINEHDPEMMERARENLRIAYTNDKKHPMVLNLLANHDFFTNNYDRASKFARLVTKCRNNEMKAEAFFQLARIHHAKGEYDAANKHYYQATRLSDKFLPAYYGLGQISVYKGSYPRARECFERVHKKMPTNLGSMKILGSLYVLEETSASAQEKATLLFQKLTERQPKDIESWIELAMRLLRSDTKRSLECFLKAKALLDDIDIPLPPALINNIACLHCLHADYAKAEIFFQEAMTEAQLSEEDAAEMSKEEIMFHKGMGVTISYNVGRLCELQGNVEGAVAQYDAILSKHKDYVDCILRKGCIARDKGDTNTAEQLFKEAQRYDGTTPRTLLGAMYMRLRQWKVAHETFNTILSKKHGDVYSLVAIGNVYFGMGNMVQAAKCYRHGVRASKDNVYSIIGLGCVYASQGDLTTAKELFQKVREAVGGTQDIPHVLINLAHTYVYQNQFVEALALYNYALKSPQHARSGSLLSAIARVHYKMKEYAKAEEALVKALEYEPEDKRHVFNIALTRQQKAYKTITHGTPTSTELEVAEKFLLESADTFASLKSPDGPVKYNFKLADKYEQRSRDLLAQLEHLKPQAKKEDERRAASKAAPSQFRSEYQRRQAEKQRQAAERKLREEEEKKARIMEFTKEKGSIGSGLVSAQADATATATTSGSTRKGGSRKGGRRGKAKAEVIGFDEDGNPITAHDELDDDDDDPTMYREYDNNDAEDGSSRRGARARGKKRGDGGKRRGGAATTKKKRSKKARSNKKGGEKSSGESQDAGTADNAGSDSSSSSDSDDESLDQGLRRLKMMGKTSQHSREFVESSSDEGEGEGEA